MPYGLLEAALISLPPSGLDSEEIGIYRNVEVRFLLVHGCQSNAEARTRNPTMTSIYSLIEFSAATSSQYLTSSIHARFLIIVTPILIRLHNFKLGSPSTSTFTREAEIMHVQSALYSRSSTAVNSSSSSGGVQESTIIFIVVGVGWSCSFVVPC